MWFTKQYVHVTHAANLSAGLAICELQLWEMRVAGRERLLLDQLQNRWRRDCRERVVKLLLAQHRQVNKLTIQVIIKDLRLFQHIHLNHC